MAIKRVIMKPSPETIHAGIIGKGCNHGTIRMAAISKGIQQSRLDNTVNLFFNLENLQAANNKIIDCVNELSLPNIFKNDKDYHHTSSDGQKFNVGVSSILASYSFKYFGQSQGISVYSFIDDRQMLFHHTLLSPGTREAAFVIDGVLQNEVIKSHMHSTDTHGYTETIFGAMHLIDVSFAPRIKKIGSQQLYSIDPVRTMRKNKHKILPHKRINIKLLEKHWDDILRLMASIKSKSVTASQIFKRLNSYTKEHPLYQALREFGRIIKTIYILTYINDQLLRSSIEKQLNRIEASNKFARAVFFANSQEFRTGSIPEQEIIVACRSLIQNSIVLWNYLYLSQVLVDLPNDERKNLLKVIKESSIITWRHVNLHGEYDFKFASKKAANLNFEMSKIKRVKIY